MNYTDKNYYDLYKELNSTQSLIDKLKSMILSYFSETVTTSSFTRGCNKFIMEESRLDGKDYQGILGWINELNRNHSI